MKVSTHNLDPFLANGGKTGYIQSVKFSAKALKTILSHKAPNRTLKNGHIKVMAEDMAAGRWVSNASQLMFDRQGKLIDGQNRISAMLLCENAGAPIPAIDVQINVERSVQDVVDYGSSRVAADTFNIKNDREDGLNIERYVEIRTALQTCYEDKEAPFKKAKLPVAAARVRLCEEFTSDYEAAAELLPSPWIGQTSTGMRDGTIIALFEELYRVDPTKAVAFYTQFKEASRKGSSADPSVAPLFHRLGDLLRGTAGLVRGNDTTYCKIWLIHKAWVAFRNGKALNSVKYNAQSYLKLIAKGKRPNVRF